MSDPKELYRRWIADLWDGFRLDLVGELVTDDFVIHHGSNPDSGARGPAAARELVEQGHAPFSSISFRIAVGPIADGEVVAARWESEGVYAGGIPGASAAAGTRVAFGGIDLMRVRDGRFCEYWVSSDGLALMEQLGAFG